jgi:hypothetical protein
MSCARPDLHERLVELVDAGASAELRAHVAECADCAAAIANLRGAWDALGAYDVAPPSAAVLARVKAAVAAEPARVEAAVAAEPVKTGRAWLVASALAAPLAGAAVLVLRGVRDDWRSARFVLAAAPVLGVAWLLGLWAAWRAAGARRAGAASTAFALTALIGLGLAFGAPAGDTFGSAACLLLSLAAAAPPLALALAAVAPTRGAGRAAMRGAMVGAATSLVGLAAVRLHCRVDALAHLLAYHAPIVPIAALAGAALAALASARIAPRSHVR